MAKAYIKMENSSKTGFILVEVVIGERAAPHGKNISVIRPVAGEGEMKVWSDKIIIKN